MDSVPSACHEAESLPHNLPQMLNIRWQDKVPDARELDEEGLLSIHSILMLSQLRWAGQVARMPDHRLPKRLFYIELQQGKRFLGGQKKRFKDTLKTSLKVFNNNPVTLEQTALDQARCVNLCEERRTAAVQQKRQARKARSSNQGQVSHIAFHIALSTHIPCSHRLDQPPAFLQIILTHPIHPKP